MMSTNLYSSFLVALAAAATAVVTGCAAGEAADDANAVALPLQSTSLPSREITPREDNEQPSGYASGQRFEENPYQRAGGEERGSAVYISIAYSQGSNVGSQIGEGAPQGSYGQPQQGQFEPPQQGQYKQPQQGQFEPPQQGQSGQPQQGQFEQPQQGQYKEPPQGQYKEPQQGQFEPPQQGQSGQPQQGQFEPPQQGQSGQPQQGPCEQPQQGQLEQPQQGQPEELPDDMQGGGVAGAYDEPVGGDVPVPVPQVVPYPVFVPTFVGYTLPLWGSLYGVGCYPYGGAFLSPRFWGLMF